MDCSSVNKEKSQGIFSHTLRQFSKLSKSKSPECYIGGVPWKIVLESHKNKGALAQRTLGFYLECCDNANNQAFNVCAELRLLSIHANGKPYARHFNKLFCSKEPSWGFLDFIIWKDVLAPANGYIDNDLITVEVHVVINSLDKILWPSTNNFVGQVSSETKTHIFELERKVYNQKNQINCFNQIILKKEQRINELENQVLNDQRERKTNENEKSKTDNELLNLKKQLSDKSCQLDTVQLGKKDLEKELETKVKFFEEFKSKCLNLLNKITMHQKLPARLESEIEELKETVKGGGNTNGKCPTDETMSGKHLKESPEFNDLKSKQNDQQIDSKHNKLIKDDTQSQQQIKEIIIRNDEDDVSNSSNGEQQCKLKLLKTELTKSERVKRDKINTSNQKLLVIDEKSRLELKIRTLQEELIEEQNINELIQERNRKLQLNVEQLTDDLTRKCIHLGCYESENKELKVKIIQLETTKRIKTEQMEAETKERILHERNYRKLKKTLIDLEEELETEHRLSEQYKEQVDKAGLYIKILKQQLDKTQEGIASESLQKFKSQDVLESCELLSREISNLKMKVINCLN